MGGAVDGWVGGILRISGWAGQLLPFDVSRLHRFRVVY